MSLSASVATPQSAPENDRLVIIPRSDWSRLQDMYRRDWPANMLGCYTLETFLRWTSQTADQTIPHLVIYSLNGDWSEDGTYLCVHRYHIFAHTLHQESQRLHRALQLLPDWRHGYSIWSLYDRLRPAVLRIWDENKFKCALDRQTRMYYMPRERAAQLVITPPPGIEIRPLRAEHAALINDLWPNRHVGSAFLIRQLIERSPNVGAFTVGDASQPIAWCLQLQSGLHGVLQVHPEHLRRGLGGLVCLAMAKLQADLGLDSSGTVFLDNYASMGMFEKAGFVVLDQQVSWMTNRATEPREWSDEL